MEKYLVASSGDSLDAKVSGRFGHSCWFLRVNPVTLEYEAFQGVTNYENQEIEKHINPSVKKVIVGNIGPSSFNEVISYGCKIYLCRNMSVREAIRKVSEGEITPLRKPTLKSSIHSARKTGYKFGGHGESVSPRTELRNDTREFIGRGMNRGTGRGLGRSGRKGASSGRGSGIGSGLTRGR